MSEIIAPPRITLFRSVFTGDENMTDCGLS